MDIIETRFLGVLCDGPGEKLRVDKATFPLEGETGSEMRRSRASKTCETVDGGVTDWSSEELEWWAAGSRSVSEPDRAAGSTDRERMLVEANADELTGRLGERDERED
jgi:hypothetical protein